MIQIIGFMGCLYLIVKALEIASGANFRTEGGSMKDTAVVASLLAWFGAAGFALWLYAQGAPLQQSEEVPTLSQTQIDCINRAKGDKEVLACK